MYCLNGSGQSDRNHSRRIQLHRHRRLSPTMSPRFSAQLPAWRRRCRSIDRRGQPDARQWREYREPLVQHPAGWRNAVNSGSATMHGFTLLPVMLTMGLIAAVAFTLNRDNGVNAAMVSNQRDADRARFAAEAGLQAVNAQVQAASCAGGFPVAAAPLVNNGFDSASYSAYATSARATPRVWFPPAPSMAHPSRSRAAMCTCIRARRRPTRCNRMRQRDWIPTSIPARNRTSGPAGSLSIKNDQQSLLFKFDLSAFPAGSRPCLGHRCRSLHSGGLLGGIDFYRLTSAWVEGNGASSPLNGATWNTSNGSVAWAPGGDTHPVKLNAINKLVAGANWVDLDATDVATAWLEGRYPNHGVLIKSTGELGISSTPAATVQCDRSPEDHVQLSAALWHHGAGGHHRAAPSR